MIDKSQVLIVIPAYNERDAIVATVREVEQYGWPYIVVNDGSTDDTAQVCRKAGINMLDLPSNLGIGGAVQSGHKYALEQGYLVDIQFDGDGQHDAQYIPKLLEALENHDAELVIGSRFVEKSEGFQSTFMRRVGIAWISRLIKLLTGATITDPTSGFRACSRSAIELFARDYPVDYPEPESIVSLLTSGSTVVEVPVQMRERQGGKSSIFGLKSAYYMIKVTLAMFIVAATSRKRRRS